MPDQDQRLYSAAAVEFALQGFNNTNLGQIADQAGMDLNALKARFPDKQSLFLALLEYIADLHQSTVRQEMLGLQDPTERLVQFIVAGFNFVERYTTLAQVVVIALFSNVAPFRDKVYQAYQRVFSLILSDLEQAGITSGDAQPLLSDLSTILLSVIFTESCPQLDLEYTSWLDPSRAAHTILEALRKRYHRQQLVEPFSR
jgi:AcrR family transcriptional regulator